MKSLMCLSTALLLLTGLAVKNAKADEWDKKTILTVKEPISVQGVVLVPGQYTIQLLNSDSTRTVVQIFSADNDHLIVTAIGSSAYRLKTANETVFTYYESQPGASRAVRDWYYPGDNFGIEFNPPRKVNSTAKSISNSQPISAAPVATN